MGVAHVNRIDMYYEVHGNGFPLVLIMGLRRNLEWWYCQIPELSRKYQVIVFDNRGAGRSDKPDMEYSIRLFADDTAELMNALGIGQAHILGISMGGYIAQELAINYPEKVKGLILGCTSPGGKLGVIMSQERIEKFVANEGLSPQQILEKDMDLYFSDSFIKNQPEKIKEFTEISHRYYQPPEAFLRQFNACLNHDTVNRLSRISSPTLIIGGDDDYLVPTQNSMILKELMPHAKLELYEGCRHCFFIEVPDRFNASVVTFLRSIDG
jgi:pimeloyl-ACP methyl ester carboxylesterase